MMICAEFVLSVGRIFTQSAVKIISDFPGERTISGENVIYDGGAVAFESADDTSRCRFGIL